MFGVWKIEGGLSIILEHSARTELSASDSLRSDVDTEKVWFMGIGSNRCRGSPEG